MYNSDSIALGIDIGGTNTKFGLVDMQGKILAKGSMKTNQYSDVHQFIQDLHENVSKISSERCNINQIAGIGIGAPNANYYRGTIEHAPNLHWKGVIPFQQLIENTFHKKCTITNDANAAALGEMIYGTAKNMKNFIMITLGTGVGSGIIANGKLIYGQDGFAGELGHTIIKPGGRQHWTTGSKGSLEAYASATGIAITAKKMRAEYPFSMLNTFPEDEINARTVFMCAEEGDETAKEVFRYTGQILGEALANFVMFSSPEAIILFGGVVQAGEYLLQPTNLHMEKNLLPIFKNKVKIICSSLHEADAAILGASALVWDK